MEEQNSMPSQQSTAHGKKESGLTVTSSTPNLNNRDNLPQIQHFLSPNDGIP